jgi:uncharacterized protein (TIGR02145 family)
MRHVLIFITFFILNNLYSQCISGDCTNGYGEWNYNEGIYIGQWKNGKQNGQGTYTGTNGDSYIGNYFDGTRNGKGKYQWKNGDVYDGDWLKGSITGFGKYTYFNGIIYEGYFVNGAHNGKGKKTFISGDIYAGDFVNNKFHGKGKYIWTNGEIYDGDWKEDQRIGKGKCFFTNGDVYEGDFTNNQMTGKGKYQWKNGETYDGDWVNGKMTGKGKRIFSNGEIYDGDWKEDQRIGKGKYFFTNGDVYEGDFIDGKFHGQGKIILQNGYIYDGEWINGQRSDTSQNLNTNNQTANSAIDKDSNFHTQTINYKSVKIGNQTWMSENLNVDRFRNGDPIPEAKTAEEWKRAGENKQPVWGDPYTILERVGNVKKNDFGLNKFYNWWAITDSRGLAPSGWHIPTDGEWVQMLNTLGGDDCTDCDKLDELGRSEGRKKVFVRSVATKLKSEIGWPIEGCSTCSGGSEAFRNNCSDCKGTGTNSKNPISYNGTNSSGMNVLPVGMVLFSISSGELNYCNYGKNSESAFWNSSVDKDNCTWIRSYSKKGDIYKFELNVNSLDANKNNYIFKTGASVRCIKD